MMLHAGVVGAAILRVAVKKRESRVNTSSNFEQVDGTWMPVTLLESAEGQIDEVLSLSAQLAAVSDTMVDARVEVVDVLIPV